MNGYKVVERVNEFETFRNFFYYHYIRLTTMKKLISLILVNLFFAACVFSQQLDTPIYTIQGEENSSPRVGVQVSTRGIVTALVKDGFFIQTPDAEVDKSAKTSEGIFVYCKPTVPVEAIVGNLVQVTGKVVEYTPRDKNVLSLTQIAFVRMQIISKDNPLPKPYILTATDLDASGKVDQMERFEGMRVKINSLTTTSGTGGRIDDKKGYAFSDGVFFGVLSGTPRPFREVGIDVLTLIIKKTGKNLPAFDMNPEMLRVDSDAQLTVKNDLVGEAKDGDEVTKIKSKRIEVTAGATIKNLTGVIHYVSGSYTLLVDAANPPTVEGNKSANPVSAAKDREVMVASFNLENFFDDEINSTNIDKEIATPKSVFDGRLKKASLAIRNILMMPDVLGVIEVENLVALKKLADKINADAVEAKQPSPNYVAYLEEGNDGRGIDVGYLIKSSRLKVVEIKQLAKDIKIDGADGKLFDRPSLMLRASFDDKGKSFDFTVIINHLKSFLGVDDDKDGEKVRTKRRLQAEWLASFLQDRAKANPAERMIMCGDFNAFEFSDGYNDLIGILKGKPSPNVVTPSKTAFQTGLIDLVDTIQKANRYSYVHDGNAQVLDHILINEAAFKNAVRFGYARLDADFPVSYYNDTNRPERISDHDGAVLYLSLDELGKK